MTAGVVFMPGELAEHPAAEPEQARCRWAALAVKEWRLKTRSAGCVESNMGFKIWSRYGLGSTASRVLA